MIIAEEKRKTNIVEYILYMYQIEDLIRANSFDMQRIETNIISKFSIVEDIRNNMRLWYWDMIEKMKAEKKLQTGHLSFILAIIEELNELHLDILTRGDDNKYNEQYRWAKNNIIALREKIPENQKMNDIEICLNGLYGYLLLKLKNKDITVETTEAISTFSNMLGLLSLRYKEKKSSP